MQIKKKQQKIEMVLTGKKIDFEKVDISLVEGSKEKMREICEDDKALPPQFCKGDKYLGVGEKYFVLLNISKQLGPCTCAGFNCKLCHA